jgi:hypothetical protein
VQFQDVVGRWTAGGATEPYIALAPVGPLAEEAIGGLNGYADAVLAFRSSTSVAAIVCSRTELRAVRGGVAYGAPENFL